MFNTYHSHRTEHVPYTKTVVEKKAPTDESIRLYGEMLDKARDSIVDSFQLDGNIVKCTCVAFEDMEKWNGKHTMSYKIIINEREIRGEFHLGIEDMHEDRKPEKALLERISKHISNAILDDMVGGFAKLWK